MWKKDCTFGAELAASAARLASSASRFEDELSEPEMKRGEGGPYGDFREPDPEMGRPEVTRCSPESYDILRARSDDRSASSWAHAREQ